MSQEIEKTIAKAGAWNALVRVIRETEGQEWIRGASGERVLEYIGGFVKEWDANIAEIAAGISEGIAAVKSEAKE